MIAVLRFQPDAGDEDFADQAQAALRVLARREGFVRGALGRSQDDCGDWMLLTEWESVGAYRRGLGHYEVKLTATPLLGQALDQPSAFEPLLSVGADGTETARASDRAADADWAAGTGDGPSQR